MEGGGRRGGEEGGLFPRNLFSILKQPKNQHHRFRVSITSPLTSGCPFTTPWELRGGGSRSVSDRVTVGRKEKGPRVMFWAPRLPPWIAPRLVTAGFVFFCQLLQYVTFLESPVVTYRIL